jgi:hypothetical protein
MLTTTCKYRKVDSCAGVGVVITTKTNWHFCPEPPLATLPPAHTGRRETAGVFVCKRSSSIGADPWPPEKVDSWTTQQTRRAGKTKNLSAAFWPRKTGLGCISKVRGFHRHLNDEAGRLATDKRHPIQPLRFFGHDIGNKRQAVLSFCTPDPRYSTGRDMQSDGLSVSKIWRTEWRNVLFVGKMKQRFRTGTKPHGGNAKRSVLIVMRTGLKMIL